MADLLTPASTERRYTAFLSYRHADNKEEGRRWAEWLHQAIETYEVPADLVGKPNTRGEPIPASLYPVFRDEEELPADADLSDNIHRALRNSTSLVVLCSPRACESRFVADEIRTFKELGKSPKILALMLDGEPNASDDPGKMGRGMVECLPQPLRFGVQKENGPLDWNQRCEPIAADARPEGRPIQGYTSGAAYRLALERAGTAPQAARKLSADYEERLNLARLKIIAGLLGVPLGNLRDRDAAYRLKKARRRQFISLVVAAVAVVLTTFALWQRHVAETQREKAQTQETLAHINEKRALDGLKEASRSDAATAQQRLAEGKWQEAVAYLGRAIRYDPGNLEARDALWISLVYGEPDGGRLPDVVFKHECELRSAQFSSDGTRVLTTSETRDPRTGERILTTGEDQTALLWDARSGAKLGAPMKHDGPVSSAVFSPDGTRVVTASKDHTARVWNALTGQSLLPPLNHAGEVTDAAFSPDGTLVATGCNEQIQLWNASSGDPIGAPLSLGTGVKRIRFSPDGTSILASGGTYHFDQKERNDGAAGIWEARTGRRIFPPLLGDSYIKVSEFNATGALFATVVMFGKTFELWDVRKGAAAAHSTPVSGSIESVNFSPDGTRLAIGSGDTTVDGEMTGHAEIWSQEGLRNGTGLPHQSWVSSARFSANGAMVLSASADGTAKLWRVGNGALVNALKMRPQTVNNRGVIGAPFQHQGAVIAAAFSPDESSILTASEDHTAAIWNLRSRKLPPLALFHPGGIEAPVFSPDGSKLAIRTRQNSAILWDLRSGRQFGPTLLHGNYVQSVEFSPDGSRLVTASFDRTARLWDVSTGSPLGAPMKHEDQVRSASFSPDGTKVVTASNDGSARLWDAATGASIGPPLLHHDAVYTASFSRDGLRIVTASEDHTARIWDARTGQPVCPPLQHEDSVSKAAFNADGTLVLTLTSNAASVWDARTGQRLGTPFRQQQSLSFASFSPNGRDIVAPDEDGAFRIWNARTGAPLIPPLHLKGGANFLSGAEFSPDGTRLVSFGSDRSIRLWSAEGGAPIGIPLMLDYDASQVSFSPDGTRIACAGSSGVGFVADIMTQELLGPMAESYTACVCGARLDSRTGRLQLLSFDERFRLWRELQPVLATLPEWRFAAQLAHPMGRRPIPISPRSDVTLTQNTTTLLDSLARDEYEYFDVLTDVTALDPTHPLLPFALSIAEAKEPGGGSDSATRARWLIDFGLKRLSVDTSPHGLRLAARLIAKIAAILTDQKKHALELLDRALKLDPNEDEETKKLRESLK